MNRSILLTLLLLACFKMNIYSQNGILKSFYPDGTIESALSFVDDVYDGTSYWFYPNGNLESEKTYSIGKLNGWIKSYYKSGLVKEEFYVNEGVKDGLHKAYYENGGLKFVKSYDKGRLVKQINLDYDVNFRATAEDYKAGNRQYLLQEKKAELLCDAEICPIPVDGLKAIQDSLIYPEHAILYGLEGVVTLIATVNEFGDVVSTEVIQGLGLGCDDAAAEAVKKNKFIPGQSNGKAIVSHITIDVEFWLDEKSKTAYKRQVGDMPVITQKDLTKNIPQQAESEEGAQVVEAQRPVTESVKRQQREIMESGNFTCTVDECPYPKGGLQAILNNLELPEIAKRVGLKGDVRIIADVDEHGFVRDTKVVKGMGHGCSEAAEVALFETEFYPGRLNNQDVRCEVEITIPIGK